MGTRRWLVLGLGWMVLAWNVAAETAERDMLEFLAAQQLESSAKFASLSYKASVVSRSFDPDLGDYIDQKHVYFIVKRSATTRITRETDSTLIRQAGLPVSRALSSKVEKIQKPLAKRVLLTPDYALYWPDLMIPELYLTVYDDWKGATEEAKLHYVNIATEVDLSIVPFGVLTPYYKLFEGQYDFIRWSVAEEAPGRYCVTRFMNHGEVPDLRLLLRPSTGACIDEGRFQAKGAQSDVKVAFAEVNLNNRVCHLPVTVERISLLEDGGVSEELRIAYSEFSDHSQEDGFTMADLELPEGAIIHKKLPRKRVEVKIWRDGKLTDPDEKKK